MADLSGKQHHAASRTMDKTLFQGHGTGIYAAGNWDPRICFALSLANIAGPPLLNEPYLPEKIDEQLDNQIKKYLSSPRGLRIDHSARTVHMSAVFKLNEKHFIKKYEQIKRFRNKKPNIRAFLNFVINYIDPDDAKRIQDGDYKVEFIRYNWTLNEQPNQTKK